MTAQVRPSALRCRAVLYSVSTRILLAARRLLSLWTALHNGERPTAQRRNQHCNLYSSESSLVDVRTSRSLSPTNAAVIVRLDCCCTPINVFHRDLAKIASKWINWKAKCAYFAQICLLLSSLYFIHIYTLRRSQSRPPLFFSCVINYSSVYSLILLVHTEHYSVGALAEKHANKKKLS